MHHSAVVDPVWRSAIEDHCHSGSLLTRPDCQLSDQSSLRSRFVPMPADALAHHVVIVDEIHRGRTDFSSTLPCSHRSNTPVTCRTGTPTGTSRFALRARSRSGHAHGPHSPHIACRCSPASRVGGGMDPGQVLLDAVKVTARDRRFGLKHSRTLLSGDHSLAS